MSSDDFIDFSFVVVYKAAEDKTSELTFKPTVSKLDLVFNLDVTGSMGKEVENLQTTLQSVVISGVRKSVEDSAFGISEFADFPIRYDKTGSTVNYGWPRGREINGGQYFKKDSPWILHSRPEKNPGELARAVNSYSLSDGGDYPEAGYESLWMLAAGDTGSAKYASQTDENTRPGSISVDVVSGGKVVNTDGRWGGAGFRQGTLPVVVHITDALSHNSGSKNNYSTTYVSGAHNDTNVHEAFNQKGIKLITIFRRGEANPKDGITVDPGSALPELENSSNATGTVVKACAFKKSATEWTCGENKCCTQVNKNGTVKATSPDGNGNCVLSYGITSAATMTETVVQGIQALVKYGTYEVSTRVRGEDITVPIIDPDTKENKGN